ncbi:MAG TPA: hypothetical protein ENK65_00195 [Helicobacteraceae bacterium]|nr:hypothetical protein [Helicobacteraceae bacterium]
MRLLTVMICVVPLVFANETKRIEDIVSDITQLRQAYEQCQNDLQGQNKSLHALTEKTQVQQVENDAEKNRATRIIEDYKVENALLLKREQKLQRELDTIKKRVASLEQLVKDQREHIASMSSNDTKVQTPCKTTNTNPFPKLLPKNAPEKKIVVTKEVTALKDDTHVASKTVIHAKEEKKVVAVSEFFDPTTFRLKEESNIFNAPHGKALKTWEAKTSFTSNEKRGAWTRITGYFVEGKWRPSGKNQFWIETKRIEKKQR